MKKNLLLYVLLFLITGAVFFVFGRFTTSSDTKEFSIIPTPIPTPLAIYSIPSLSQKTEVINASFEIDKTIKETEDFSSFEFKITFDPTLQNKMVKSMSGMINIPKKEGTFPIILMIRGYVDPKNYAVGTGTKNAAEFFAKNGFITIAPDFFGYADSDQEAGNIFETRFQTYTTLLAILNLTKQSNFRQLIYNFDQKNVLLWAHSNGGQIALTTLSITKEALPTVLWAPVTKPFPYNVLYYTDESVDGGKLIRRELSKFESIYDSNEYSFTNYLDNIIAPIEFDQGTADDAVPFEWTRSISNLLKKKGLEVLYNEYKGSDHNLRPAWNSVVENNLEFYKNHLR